ncbi:His Kinase A domain containing protein [Linnemannia zychae]|nr:His Kinase A domain containing protein [Linnemannia zychae]
MAPTPSTPPPSATNELIQDQTNQDISQRRRPRFLRAITSPVPVNHGLNTTTTSSSSSSSVLHASDHTSPLSTSGNISFASQEPVHSQEQTRPSRPQLHPVQLDLQQNEGQLRSFSTSSVLPSYVVHSGNVTSGQSKNSITETLKEHRWSKGLKLNWMSAFGGRAGPGLENSLQTSSSISSSSSSSRSSQQKSIRRRKSEGTGLRISKESGADASIDGPGLGLFAPLIASGKLNSRNNKTGIETSVDQLKVSEARTRRISDSGLSTASRNSGTGLAERLSGFAQTVRGLSRSSFSVGHSSPTMTSSSSCSTPSTPGLNSSYTSDLRTTGTSSSRQRNTSNIESENMHFDSWDEFIHYYRQGLFPSDHPIPQPQLDTAFPPTPSYAATSNPLPYLAPPLPLDEERRLQDLYNLQILQSGIDPSIERLARLAANTMKVKGCMITLVDRNELIIKAQHPPSGFECFPRESSICGHTILRTVDDPFVVLDTKSDWRFQNLGTVNADPYIRFYAGAPLTTSTGFNVGSLCIVDDEPRTTFTEEDRINLNDFAAVVMREMELWNDQVQLCIRNRMMRDVTRWVRGCLDFGVPDSPNGDGSTPEDSRIKCTHPLEQVQPPLPTPSDLTTSSSGTLDMVVGPALISPPIDPVFPTPSGSPTLLSRALGTASKATPQIAPTVISGNPLQDRAFPAACILIQATLNVDAVYLVQASSDQSIIPQSGSSVVWNYLDSSGRRKGSVGIVKGGQTLDDAPNTALVCLASSQKNTDIFSHPVLDEKVQHTKRQGSAWICTDEGCRPHRLGDSLLNAVEPVWERDMPIIKEMLGYVRQEIPTPPQMPGQSRLFSYSQGQDAMENDWFGASTSIPSLIKDPIRRRMLCHTFQGTVPLLSSAFNTPYKSCVVVPIQGPTMEHTQSSTDDEPWAYFVILSASQTKQFTFHERIYLKNFGSCMVTEVMKYRMEAADKAKGTFIKSISHELRTPLHIILGILELLYANPEEPLSETQLAMVYSAEASGKSLIDSINNIIDLANLDPDSNTSTKAIHGNRATTPSPENDEPVMEEVDIRDLCEKVAESMAKACTDKNLIVIPSWTKPSLSSLSTPTSSSVPTSATGVTVMRTNSMPASGRGMSVSDDAANGSTSPAETHSGFSSRKLRSDRKPVIELMVAMDEPERDPDHDTLWNFSLDTKTITRILTQLVENAIKFTATGFVELSAVALTNSPIPMKPPHPDARAILFTVRDTGKGISAEFVQSHLFKRFSQEDPLKVGTGLGLALVKELVKKLGGWMEVWSEGIEGKGCVVKVLIWASPASHPTKSLKDMDGPWQNMSCRFYAGEFAIGSDRLFKIIGERMMGQQLSMKVERGNEQDTSAEDMLKPLADGSQCNLLVLNDDLIRLRAYLTYWTDKHALTGEDGEMTAETPTPLLMLTAPYNLKSVQKLIDEYLETQAESDGVIRPASIVILNKPTGPLKLTQSLRDCFTPAFSSPGLQTPQGSPRLSSQSEVSKAHPMPMIRSATVPHITTTTLGVNDSRLLSAGTMIKQSFVFPIMQQDRQSILFIPPHSPGGLVLPPRSSADPSSATTSEQESRLNHDLSKSSIKQEDAPRELTEQESDDLELFRANIEANAPIIRPQRPIKNNASQKQLQLEKTVVANSTTDLSCSDRPLPRVLIVEDNITNRMILRTFLKKRGIGVVEAENGLLGVERFQEEVWRRDGKSGFEFVLMDLQMPIMDGNVATRKIREFEQSLIKQNQLNSNESDLNRSEVSNVEEGGYRRTTIFALTGLAADEDKRLAFECGVNGYLTKPVSLKTLGELLLDAQVPV